MQLLYAHNCVSYASNGILSNPYCNIKHNTNPNEDCKLKHAGNANASFLPCGDAKLSWWQTQKSLSTKVNDGKVTMPQLQLPQILYEKDIDKGNGSLTY